jgi:profilin
MYEYLGMQAYIDQQLMMPLASGGTLDHAAICGLDGGVWAQSESFPGLSDQECETILKGLEDISILGEKGVTIGGNKFMLIASDPEDGIIRGKNGPSGVTIKKTVSGLVIGMYGDKVTPGECNVVVENLADYLKEQGI